MKNLMAKHISEIGIKNEPLQKFAKGNVVPQKRLSLDVSATLFNKGDIGAGREDFWIIGVDKNGTKTWKPLGLKDDFKYFKEETLIVFDGSGTISFLINKNFVSDRNLQNGICISVYNLSGYSITLEFDRPLLGGLQCKGTTADEMYINFANKIDSNNEYSFIENAMPDAFEDGTIDTTYNYLKNPSERKLKKFFYYLRLLIEFAFKIENKYYGTAKSQISSKAENEVNEILIKNYLMKLPTQSTTNNLLTPAEQIEEYRQKFLKTQIIDNLPPLIKGIAINEQVKQGNLRNEYLRLDDFKSVGNFDWIDSDYGNDIWRNIDNGKWDDPTLMAFAPNLEDLLSPPPQYVPQNITTNFGLSVGDKLPQQIINDWSNLSKNYFDETTSEWIQTTGYFQMDREIAEFRWLDGQLGFRPSGSNTYLKAEGFKDFMDKQLGLTTTPQNEPTLTNQEERIFSNEELQKLIQEKNFQLDDFEKIRILVSSPIRSENFQNLIFILGGMWFGGKKEALYLYNEALFTEYGKLSFGNENTFLNSVDYRELQYEEIFSSLLFPTKKQIETIEPLVVEEPKMDITIDINSLEDEYNDVMFLIDVTPKVDIVAITELKQRAYDLKKMINAKHLERTDVMLQGNNIFAKLFESSSVEPIFRYDLTPDPNSFAPDGTPTTLPKSIYELCQTPDFINWFGDYRSAYNYRNSPFSEVPCSVVKTEHFEPMIVFHGTGSEFSYFDFEKFPAMYFAQNFSYAEWFAEQKGGREGTIGYVYPFLLNIRNYLDLTDFGIDEISYQEFADAIFLQTGLEPEELKISQALIQDQRKVWAWVYLRNSPEFLKTLRDLKLFDGIIYYEQNPPINPTAPNYMTKGFIIFEPQNAKIVAPNRKELLLPSMRSFYLKKGGKL